MIRIFADLYRPGQQVASRVKPRWTRTENTTAVSVGINLRDTLADPNYAFLLRALFLRAQTQGGENVVSLALNVRSPETDATPTVYGLKRSDTAGAANASVPLDWQGEVLLLPNWQIYGQITKNAGVNALSAGVMIAFGFLLPTGDLAL